MRCTASRDMVQRFRAGTGRARREDCWRSEKALEQQVEQLKNKLAQAAVGDLEAQARTVKGVKVLAAQVDGMDRAAAAHAGRFAAQQVEERRGRAGLGRRFATSRSSRPSPRI